MEIVIVKGDITEVEADCIVNSWNRNIFPWWLLIPQGVSGAIRKKAGIQPFMELAKMKMIPLGDAVITSAGRLPYKAIIHVAGINLIWRASEFSIKNSVLNSMKAAEKLGVRSVAMPIIGAGSGGFKKAKAQEIITQTLKNYQSDIRVILVEY